jgi:alanine racemase
MSARSPSRRAARHSSRITLSRSAVKNNLDFIRRKVGPHPVISAVVKANAFGHGIAEFVPLAERAGVHHFSVASSFEAQEVLEAASDEATIMIMGILYDEDLPWVIENGIEFFVFDLARLERAAEVAKEVDVPAVVHLEVETGGNRTGLPEDQLGTALSFLKANRQHLRFEGLCTHFAGIETLANQFRIAKQMKRFEAAYAKAKKAKVVPAKRHTACSAAALGFPETVMDLVRVGTACYGFWPSPDIYNLHLKEVGKASDAPLQRVLGWETDVMHLKRVGRDDFIGYGTSFQAPHDMTVAVLPIGYSNGYPRDLSNRGHVLIRGKKAPVVGLVNMNVFMVDVTHIPGVQVGDTAVLVGRQKNNAITVRSFSEFANALNNEFASRLPAAIPRTAVR